MSLIKKVITLSNPEEEIHTNQIVIINNTGSGKKNISYNVMSKIIDDTGDVDLVRKEKHPTVSRNLEDVFMESVTFTNELGIEVTLTGATITLGIEEFFVKHWEEDQVIKAAKEAEADEEEEEEVR